MAKPRKTRAEKAALKRKRERSAAKAIADYEAAKKAERAKTARLRALRLDRSDHVADSRDRGKANSVTEEKSERGPADPARVALKEKYEREYWKKKFGVSTTMLAEAVRVVGPSAENVEQYLKDK